MSKKPISRLKVLHLARWYPNRYDPMPGLFIQRHAEAANLCSDVGVVYTHQVADLSTLVDRFEVDFNVINNVLTAKVYYKESKCRLFPINKFINIFRFIKANRIGINKIDKELGGFDLMHIHILTRLGFFGLYHKIFHGKPYVITEHWSRYLDLTGSFTGFFRKLFTRIIVKNAACVTAVTDNLATAMKSHGLANNNYVILPNVVDSVFLDNKKVDKPVKSKTTFLHVSCFEDKSKNISGLIRVISNLSKLRNDFIFRMVGDGMDMEWLFTYANDLGLIDSHIQFTGLLEGSELVDEMANSDMLIIFSNYENFPVVINESLSLGIPVIATRVGGIPERINDENGALVDPGNEDQLQNKLVEFLDGQLSFNMDSVEMKAIDEFSPKSIGKVLCGLYEDSIK